MDKLLDILTRLEHLVNFEDGAWREWMLSEIHQAMDIAVDGKAHKWPEEKPESDGLYVVRMLSHGTISAYDTLVYNTTYGKWYGTDFQITHWWHLPEVKE